MPGKAILLYLIKPWDIDINHKVFNNRVKFYAIRNQKSIFHQINLKKPNGQQHIKQWTSIVLMRAMKQPFRCNSK